MPAKPALFVIRSNNPTTLVGTFTVLTLRIATSSYSDRLSPNPSAFESANDRLRPPAQLVQNHHVFPWELGAHTKLGNLVLLCDFHHHLVHKPGWTATFDGITFTVTNPDGRVIGGG